MTILGASPDQADPLRRNRRPTCRARSSSPTVFRLILNGRHDATTTSVRTCFRAASSNMLWYPRPISAGRRRPSTLRRSSGSFHKMNTKTDGCGRPFL
ncbi:MAG: hypothetical protein MZU97_11835 [Bacillus subtilis]|nr:hypothetical protein [Bacillus subtilis]